MIDVHEATYAEMKTLVDAWHIGFFFSSSLIRDMLPIINPDEDYLTIVAAEEKIASSEAKRKKELEEAHAQLKCSCLIFELTLNPI